MTARRFGRMIALACALSGVSCTIVKVYRGSKLKGNPAAIVAGQTTMADVLAQFGAPSRIQRRVDGDVFVYAYVRRDSMEIAVEESFVTNTELFNYTTIEEKSDRLIVLFDAEGVVRARGFAFGTRELDGEEEEDE